MKGKEKQRYLWYAGLMVVIMLFCTLTAPTAQAAVINNGFSSDVNKTQDAFCQFYGWDKNKLLAKTWEGKDGHIYHREVGNQKEYMDDIAANAFNYLMGSDPVDRDNPDYVKPDGAYAKEIGITDSKGPLTNREVTEKLLELGEPGGMTIGPHRGILLYGSGGKKMVEIAKAELGNRDSSGGDGYIKYNDWYYGTHSPGAWCVVFLQWCANQAGLDDVLPWCADTGSLWRGCSSRGYSDFSIYDTPAFGGSKYMPVPGDLIIYTTDAYDPHSSAHTGIIVNADAQSITTVEGNTSGGVVASHRWTKSNWGYWGNAAIIHVNYPDDAAEQEMRNQIKVIFGVNDAAMCGIFANIYACSGGDPVFRNTQTGGYGLFGFDHAQKKDLSKWCVRQGIGSDTVNGQLRYMAEYLNNHAPATLSALRSVKNNSSGARSAAAIFSPYVSGLDSTQRINVGELAGTELWEAYGSQSGK